MQIRWWLIGLAAMGVAGLVGCSPAEDPVAPEEGSADVTGEAPAAEPMEPAEPEGPDQLVFAGIDEPRGVRIHDTERTSDGYIMYSPLISNTTYLIDRDGQVVHTWTSDYAAGSEYLQDNGDLLRGGRVPDAPRFNGGGQNGRIERISWGSDLLWSFELADQDNLLHHDFEPLPNGNILSIAWEAIDYEDALDAGRRSEMLPRAGLWPDLVVEIEPGEDGGRIVWQWRAWDHLIQNTDPELPNYGEPADHPGRVDVNSGAPLPEITAEQLPELKATNQIPGNATVDDRGADFHHSNGIDYNATLDQIAISVRALSEIWIIDHGLSTEAAAGPDGDLLYRWGNPATYGRDGGKDGLGHQHDVRWIPEGYPGAGNLMAFSNDAAGAQPPYSQVVEFKAPMDDQGGYVLEAGQAYGPAEAAWTYEEEDFYSPFISGAHRMSDGNTMITFGPQGRFVEVTPDGNVVWEYWTPYTGDVRMPDGTWPQPGAPFFYSVFRASFIPADHPALAGRDLQPLNPQPPVSVLPEDELAPFRKEVGE